MKDPFAEPSNKPNRRLRLIISALIILGLFVGTVLATWIYSNIITVQVSDVYSFTGFQVDDSTPDVDQQITFSGTLELNGEAVGSGYTIALFIDTTQVGSGSTDGSGHFSIPYTVDTAGSFDFKVGYDIS